MRTVIQLLAILLIPISLFAQTPESGHFEMKLIGLESTDPDLNDGGAILKEWLGKRFEHDLFFNKESLVQIFKDDTGAIANRIVQDKKSGLYYFFQYENGQKFYYIDSTQIWARNQFPELSVDSLKGLIVLGSQPDPVKTILGFECRKVEFLNPSEEGEVFMTAYLADVYPFSDNDPISILVAASGFSLETTMNYNNIRIQFGAVSFSETISDETVFSINTAGFIARTKEETGLFSDEDDFEQPLEAEEESAPGLSVNLDIYRKMVEDGVISKNQDGWDLPLVEEVNGSIDFPTLVHKARSNLIGLPTDSILFYLDKYGLISAETKSKTAMYEAQIKELGEEIPIYHIIELLVLQDYINDPHRRKQLVDNLARLGYRQKDESHIPDFDDFLKGEIDLEDFIMRFEGFIDVEVKDGVATIEELEKEVEIMLRKVFANIAFDLSVDAEALPDGKFQLLIKFNFDNYVLPVFNNEPKSSFGEQNELPDSIRFDMRSEFTDNLISLCYQIGVDYEQRDLYNVYSFEKAIMPSFDFDMPMVLANFPELAVFKRKRVFQRLPSQYRESVRSGNSLFLLDSPAQQSGYKCNCLEITGFYKVNEVNLIETQFKHSFLSRLRENSRMFDLDEGELAKIEQRVTNETFSEKGELALVIPKLFIRISDRNFFTRLDAPKGKDSFKKSFERLDYFLKGDFKPKITLIKSSPGAIFKVDFKYKGKAYSIEEHFRSFGYPMLKIAQELMAEKSKNSKDIYLLPFEISGFSQICFYLNENQKTFLEELLDFKFRSILD